MAQRSWSTARLRCISYRNNRLVGMAPKKAAGISMDSCIPADCNITDKWITDRCAAPELDYDAF